MIYLDSCIVIYATEDAGPRGASLRRMLAEAGGEIVAISPLVMLECLVGPLRDDNLMLRDHYERVFTQFHVLDLGSDVYRRAAELRAKHGIRTPDALHLAAAQLSGCDVLWTNDARLARASHGLARDVSHA